MALREEIALAGLSPTAQSLLVELTAMLPRFEDTTWYAMSHVTEAYRAPEPMLTLPYVVDDAIQYCTTGTMG